MTKKLLVLSLVVMGLTALGAKLSVEVFSAEGSLNTLGLSILAGWVVMLAIAAGIILPKLARWATPLTGVALFLGLVFPEKMYPAINALWRLAQQVEPIGIIAGGGFVAICLCGVSFLMLCIKKKEQEEDEAPFPRGPRRDELPPEERSEEEDSLPPYPKEGGES